MLTENKIDDAILVSVNAFIKELQSRISIYDESTASNLDPVSFDLINSIIYKYTKRSIIQRLYSKKYLVRNLNVLRIVVHDVLLLILVFYVL